MIENTFILLFLMLMIVSKYTTGDIETTINEKIILYAINMSPEKNKTRGNRLHGIVKINSKCC